MKKFVFFVCVQVLFYESVEGTFEGTYFAKGILEGTSMIEQLQ